MEHPPDRRRRRGDAALVALVEVRSGQQLVEREHACILSRIAELRLITIPISHYCEKARWALELAGLPYREEPHLQAIHWAHVWRAGRGRTAPVLVTPEVTLTESADILRWVDARSDLRLYPDPEAAALEARFDAELGPHGRRWMYHRVLGRPDLVRAYGATASRAGSGPCCRASSRW